MPDNVTSMMFNDENGPPWHGKGEPVKGLATARECIRAAGLDWDVAKIPLRIGDEGGLPVHGKMVTVRTDLLQTNPSRILGVVGDEYKPLQNWEAFGFFDKVIEQGAAIYETAGAIENGKRIWLLTKLPSNIVPIRGDEVIPYILLANGHDGLLMVHIKFTPIRVVCQNTLAMALKEESGRHVAVRHTRNLQNRLNDAAILMGIIKSTVKKAETLWSRMVKRELRDKNVEIYFRSVFGGKEEDQRDDENDLPQRPLTGLKKKAMENFESDDNKRLRIHGTLWAAYNAAIWAVDRGRNSQKDRVDDLCIGEGAHIKEKAMTEAEKLLYAFN